MKELVKFTLRLDLDLYTRLKARAEKEQRSLANLIIYILTNATK